jgi:hypothetical protein
LTNILVKIIVELISTSVLLPSKSRRFGEFVLLVITIDSMGCREIYGEASRREGHPGDDPEVG